MQQQDNQITIIVSGPNASGKTAIAALIADMLTHTAKFTDVRFAYPEEAPHSIKEKEAALIGGDMVQVLNNPVVIAETAPLKLAPQDNGRTFTGHFRTGQGERYYQWGPAPIEGYTFVADVTVHRYVETPVELPLNPALEENTNKVLSDAVSKEHVITERVLLDIAVPNNCHNPEAYVADAVNEILRDECRPQAPSSSLVDYKFERPPIPATGAERDPSSH